jgi:hypothetical protein
MAVVLNHGSSVRAFEFAVKRDSPDLTHSTYPAHLTYPTYPTCLTYST